MIAQLRKDAASSELAGIDALIASLDEDDFIGRQSLAYRRNELAAELAQVADAVETHGHVLLSFEGGPVVGSHGVDASFASRTLSDYQDLITKQVAASGIGALAARGPVPAREAGRLNITSVVHGSFGFELEEHGVDQLALLDTPVKTAIAVVDDVVAAFAGTSDEVYRAALASVDRRVFISVQSFFDNLYKDSASIKIVEDARVLALDSYAVLRARDRIRGVEVVDEDLRKTGELLGLTPVSRTFDLLTDDGEVITGRVGQKLSDDYLERLHGSERISGQRYDATLIRRRAVRADGSTNESYTLVDLDPAGQRKLPPVKPPYAAG